MPYTDDTEEVNMTCKMLSHDDLYSITYYQNADTTTLRYIYTNYNLKLICFIRAMYRYII